MTDSQRPSLRQRASTLRKKGWARLRGGVLTPRRAAASVALGLFIGCIPVFGLHLPLCLAACLPLRLDTPVAYLAANISNPFVAPWLILAEVQVGAFLLTGQAAPFDIETAKHLGVGSFLSFALVGALIVGAILAVLGGALAGLLTHLVRRRSKDQPATNT